MKSVASLDSPAIGVGSGFFEQRRKENCKRTARRFGELLFLLSSLSPFWIRARESEVSFGELLPHL
jgi:hypothetical protein